MFDKNVLRTRDFLIFLMYLNWNLVASLSSIFIALKLVGLQCIGHLATLIDTGNVDKCFYGVTSWKRFPWMTEFLCGWRKLLNILSNGRLWYFPVLKFWYILN